MAGRPISHAMTTTGLTLDGYRSTKSLGVNAVVGVRYDATEVMQGATEVLCYGTAVVMVPA